MPKIQFIDKLHLNKSNKAKLDVVNNIIEEYRKDGYVLTLRQLYYQLVSRDIIPNNQSEYAKVSQLLVQGRMAGFVDWDCIEDRVRKPKLPYWVTGIPDAINDIVKQYRLDRQHNQENYIEIWTEKDAISNILYRVSEYYHIRLMVNRGYSSCSALYEAYRRFKSERDWDKKLYILYLGDHDPSGLNMIEDIHDRLNYDFGLDNSDGGKVNIIHIGLTDEQIEKYNPPPNPTKIKDPRANEYMAKYGNTCWEVDALNPKILTEIVETNIKDLIDIPLFESMIEKEKQDIETLKKLQKEYK